MHDAVSEFFYSCSGKPEGESNQKSFVSKRPTHADQIKIKKIYTDEHPHVSQFGTGK